MRHLDLLRREQIVAKLLKAIDAPSDGFGKAFCCRLVFTICGIVDCLFASLLNCGRATKLVERFQGWPDANAGPGDTEKLSVGRCQLGVQGPETIVRQSKTTFCGSALRPHEAEKSRLRLNGSQSVKKGGCQSCVTRCEGLVCLKDNCVGIRRAVSQKSQPIIGA